MTNFLPDTDEEIKIEYRKIVESNVFKNSIGKKRRNEQKRPNSILDGDDSTIIDKKAFDVIFEQFKFLVEKKGGYPFDSFSNNSYIEDKEGYKKDLYNKARKALSVDGWRKEEIGRGKIFANIIAAIRLDKTDNNLIDWRLADSFEKKGEGEHLFKFEECFYDFFIGDKSEEESLECFIEYFGKNYPLIAYFFFIKDKERFMPNNPSHSDRSFEKLGVKSFRSARRCSWKNYSKYNNLLSQVRDRLLAKGIKDVNLLDAHSFVWMIYDIEKKNSKLENNI